MKGTRRLNLWTVTALVLVVSMILPWAVWADDVDVDQLDTTSANNPLDLGDICAGASKTGTATFEIRRQGSGNVFANGATVTVSVDTFPTGLSAIMSPSGAPNDTIVLPPNWTSMSNGTLSSDNATSDVTVNAGLITGSFSAVVKYAATGNKNGGGTLTVNGNLNVEWTVITCQANQPPTVDAGGPYSGNEGSAISLDGTVTDPDTGDTLTYAWTYAYDPNNLPDAGTTCSFGDATAVDTTITCNDDGGFILTLTANDGHGHQVSDMAALTVYNVAPDITKFEIVGDGYVFAVNTPVDFAVEFTDSRCPADRSSSTRARSERSHRVVRGAPAADRRPSVCPQRPQGLRSCLPPFAPYWRAGPPEASLQASSRRPGGTCITSPHVAGVVAPMVQKCPALLSTGQQPAPV